jgi:hypothetical protein
VIKDNTEFKKLFNQCLNKTIGNYSAVKRLAKPASLKKEKLISLC